MRKVICKVKGGFANQCVQYLFSATLAKKTNRKLVLDISDYSFFCILQKIKKNSIQKLFVGFESELTRRFYLPFMFRTSAFSDGDSVDSLLNHKDGDIYLNGYWHDVEYVKFIDGDVKMILHNKILSLSSEKIKSIVEQIHHTKTSVSIHVRRGDYLKGKYKNVYGTCPLSYYKDSVNGLVDQGHDDIRFFVFSDDVEWVKENFTFLGEYYISSDTSFLDDFILMMSCKVNIIANSSFSWLASQLNTAHGAKKISPSQWFKDENRKGLPLDDFDVLNVDLD